MTRCGGGFSQYKKAMAAAVVATSNNTCNAPSV
jgi:hypothetical protein